MSTGSLTPLPPTGEDERHTSSVPTVMRSRSNSSTYASERGAFLPPMLDMVAPVAR